MIGLAMLVAAAAAALALGAPLITVAGYQALLLAMALIITLVGVYLLTRPEQRQAARGLSPAARRPAAERRPHSVGGRTPIGAAARASSDPTTRSRG